MLTALVATSVTAVWWTVEVIHRRRHRPPPSDDRELLAHLGVGLAFMNSWTLICSVLPYAIAALYRIHIEERVLADTFAEYAEYAHTTKRLVPWVY